MGTDEVRVVTTGALADTGNVMTGSQNIQTGAVITGHQEVTQIPVVEHVYPPVLSGAQKFAHVSALS